MEQETPHLTVSIKFWCNYIMREATREATMREATKQNGTEFFSLP